MFLHLNKGVETGGLPVGEQVSVGVQGSPPGPVERIALETASAVELLLDSSPTPI